MPDENLNVSITAIDRAAEVFKRLAQDVDRLGKEIQGLGGSSEGARRAADETKRLAESQKQAADAAKRQAEAVQGLIGAASSYIGLNFASHLLTTAARTETLGVALNTVARNAGISRAEIARQEDAVKQLGITTQEARANLARMIQANLDLSKATDLARVAQDAAVLAGENSSQTFARLLHGITTLQPEMLRQAGIVVNLEQEYRAWAQTAKRTIESLTAQEKQQIALNAVLREGAKLFGTYEEAQETAGKAMTSLKRLVEEAENALGTGFLPAFKGVIDLTGGFLSLITAAPQPVRDLAGAASFAATGFITLEGAMLAARSAGILTTATLASLHPYLAAIAALLATVGWSVSKIQSIDPQQVKRLAEDVAGTYGVYESGISGIPPSVTPAAPAVPGPGAGFGGWAGSWGAAIPRPAAAPSAGAGPVTEKAGAKPLESDLLFQRVAELYGREESGYTTLSPDQRVAVEIAALEKLAEAHAQAAEDTTEIRVQSWDEQLRYFKAVAELEMREEAQYATLSVAERKRIELEALESLAEAKRDSQATEVREQTRTLQEQYRLQSDYFGKVRLGLAMYVDDWRSADNRILNITREFGQAATRSLDDLFFNTLTGRFKSLTDVVESFGNSLLRIASNQLAQSTMSMLFGGGGGLGGLLGGLGSSLWSGLGSLGSWAWSGLSSVGGFLGFLQTGMWNVPDLPGQEWAVLHPGEMVLPPAAAGLVRSLGGVRDSSGRLLFSAASPGATYDAGQGFGERGPQSTAEQVMSAITANMTPGWGILNSLAQAATSLGFAWSSFRSPLGLFASLVNEDSPFAMASRRAAAIGLSQSLGIDPEVAKDVVDAFMSLSPEAIAAIDARWGLSAAVARELDERSTAVSGGGWGGGYGSDMGGERGGETSGVGIGSDVGNEGSGDRGWASGGLFTTRGKTKMVVGEAGEETVAVLRNPRTVQAAAGTTINVNITVQGGIYGEAGIDALSRKVAASLRKLTLDMPGTQLFPVRA